MHNAELLVELGLVLIGLSLLGRLASRLGSSPIPLYLIAGLAFGSGGLLPLHASEDFVGIGADIGVVLLLFSLGLEYTPEELIGAVRSSALVGVADAVANFVPGLAAGLLLGWDIRAAVLLGGVTWVSSSGIAAKLLTDLGRVGNRETPAVLALLVIEDLAMAGYLPLAAGLAKGGRPADIALTFAIGAAAVVGAGWLAFRYGPALSRAVFDPERADGGGQGETLLFAVLGLTLAVAGAAEALSVSAAVGAFLVGVALSGPAADAAKPLLDPLRDLFAGVFFVFFGLSVDPGSLLPALPAAALLAAVTIPAKVAVGWWAAGRLGVSRAGRARAGTTLVARGEFSVVVASLALMLEPDLAAVAAAYVLMTAVAGPLLARSADSMALRFTPG